MKKLLLALILLSGLIGVGISAWVITKTNSNSSYSNNLEYEIGFNNNK